jgi:hypothetical protein
MSIAVIDYPVKAVGQNVFGGNSPVEITFKREDVAVVDTEQGVDNTVIINLGSDITSSINVGESVYLSSESYDLTAVVLQTDSAFIRIATEWVENTDDGYLNYKQNYYTELDIIDPSNENIKILPFTLRDDGDEKGNIIIDLSIINDLNAIDFPDYSAVNEMADSRVQFDIRYREIWRESLATAYTRITDPIIIYPAKETGQIEAFSNGFDNPEYYKGYNNGAVFLHSDADPLGSVSIVFYYDEKDINKQTIKPNQKIGELAAQEVYGRLFAPLVDLVLLPETEFITLRSEAADIPEFSPTDFTSDFNIG